MKISPHENPKQFPALAPGPARMFTPQTSTAVSRPKKNSTACLACKAAKRKCSGPDAPCKACRSTNTICLFDPSRDLRRKVAVKRTIQELTSHLDLLKALLDTLASDDRLQFDKVVDLIQKKATFKDIAHAVGCPTAMFGDSQELSETTKSVILIYSERPIENLDNEDRRPSDAGTIASSPEEIPNMKPPQWPTVSPYARVTLESLCDIPLFEVPAKPWTKITNDDYLVSHLVSLYFTWDHPCSQFLDQRIFLDHMKLRRRSEFCTPLLVNSLLSMASTYSDSPDVLSTPENVFSRGQNFFLEAQRLWEIEDDHHDLPNIQALLMMCCVFKCQGRTRKSWMMLTQAVQLARDIGLFDAPSVSNKKMLPEMERVCAITAWGVFNLSSQMSIELQKIASLEYPTLDVKLCGNDDFDWTPYPRSNKVTYDKKPALLPKVREGLAEVTRILVDVQKLGSDKIRGATLDELWNKAHGPFDRLNDWLQHWPGVPEAQRNSVPQVLLLRIQCLQAIIYLFEGLKDPHEPQYVRQAQFYQVKAVEEMANCLRIHRQSYGLNHIPSQIVDAIQAGLRISVHQLEESDQTRQAFTELCRFGTALSHRFKQTADVIHEVRRVALHLDVQLPAEVIEIFDDPEQWSLEP